MKVLFVIRFVENGLSDVVDEYVGKNVYAYSPDFAMERIGTQKWVALFSQGFEAWTEWRRTKQPALTPAQDGYISEIPSRLRYESNESSVNKVNYDAAVSQIGGNGDDLTTKVWWMD